MDRDSNIYESIHICIQDTLSSRAALGLPAVQPLGQVRRASKGILYTTVTYVVCKIPLLARRTRPKG